jgi:hypothetical protein
MGWYSIVERRMHGDAKFRALSAPQPNGQSLWQYLLTGPHCTIVPGLFALGEATLAERLGWPLEDTRRCLAEILEAGMARIDRRAGLIWLPNALKHNQPKNPNVVVGWRDTWALLPECPLLEEARESLRAQLADRDAERAKADTPPAQSFVEAFDISLGRLPPKASTNPSGKAKGKPKAPPVATSDDGANDPPNDSVNGSVDPSVNRSGSGSANRSPNQDQDQEQDQEEEDPRAGAPAHEAKPPPPPSEPKPAKAPERPTPAATCPTVEHLGRPDAAALLQAFEEGGKGAIIVRAARDIESRFANAAWEMRLSPDEVRHIARYFAWLVAKGELAWTNRRVFGLDFFVPPPGAKYGKSLTELWAPASQWQEPGAARVVPIRRPAGDNVQPLPPVDKAHFEDLRQTLVKSWGPASRRSPSAR